MFPDHDLDINPKVAPKAQHLDDASAQPPGTVRKLSDFHINNRIMSRVQVIPVADGDLLRDLRVVRNDVVLKLTPLELAHDGKIPTLKHLQNTAFGPAVVLHLFNA